MIPACATTMARSCGTWLLVAAILTGAAAPVRADGSPRSPEYLIKAAYLYNFALFVEWPADAFGGSDAPLVIGIVGADPFGWAIDQTLENKRIGRRRIVVERLQPNQDPRRCQILFIAPSERARTSEIVQRVQGHPVLVVAEASEPGKPPGTVDFVVNDNKVGFIINLDAARRARLTISSKMLGLARSVR